jgi:hypothetical protein
MNMKRGAFAVWLVMLLLCLAVCLTSACGDDDDDDDSGDVDENETFCGNIAECDLGDLLDLGSMEECKDYLADQTDSVVDCVRDATGCTDLTACLIEPEVVMTAELFCEKVAGCEEVTTYVVDGACQGSAAVMEQDSLDCAEEESCGDFVACVEATEDGWALDTLKIQSLTVLISAPDFIAYNPIGSGVPKVSPNELGQMAYLYDDQTDCDLGGGKIWTSLDGVDYEVAETISLNAKCRMTSDFEWGFQVDLDGDYMEEGSHTFYTVITDINGRQSDPKTKNYQVVDHDFAIGSTMSDFTLSGINAPAKSGWGDISLSDFAGQVVLINSFAMW